MNLIIFTVGFILTFILLILSFKFTPLSVISFIIALLFFIPLVLEPNPTLSYDVIGCTTSACSTTTLSYSMPREIPIVLLITVGVMPMILFLKNR